MLKLGMYLEIQSQRMKTQIYLKFANMQKPPQWISNNWIGKQISLLHYLMDW